VTAKKGKIYFAQASDRIKIGFSRNVGQRLSALQSIYRCELEIIETVEGTLLFERAIHDYLSAHRLVGEWFADCAEVRETISEIVRSGPSAIGYADKPKKQRPPSEAPAYDYKGEIVRGIRLLLTDQVFEAALEDKELLALCVETATASTEAIKKCKGAGVETTKLVAMEFVGKCAARALRGLDRT
jgi:hypothetical protein